jgi:hypothetical protein
MRASGWSVLTVVLASCGTSAPGADVAEAAEAADGTEIVEAGEAADAVDAEGLAEVDGGCPPGVVPGGACATDADCTTEPFCQQCGVASYVIRTANCLCAGGSWACDHVDCGPFAPGTYEDPECTILRGGADADADGPVDGPEAEDAPLDELGAGDADAEGGADACPACVDATYRFGWDGGMVMYFDRFAIRPCSSLEARRETWEGDVIASCDADIAGCDPSGATVTSAHIAAALARPDVQAAFALGSVLYGRDTRPVDGVVFRVLREGTPAAEILIGSDCLPGDPGCVPAPADVLALRDVLLALEAQVPGYPGAGCAEW